MDNIDFSRIHVNYLYPCVIGFALDKFHYLFIENGPGYTIFNIKFYRQP